MQLFEGIRQLQYEDTYGRALHRHINWTSETGVNPLRPTLEEIEAYFAHLRKSGLRQSTVCTHGAALAAFAAHLQRLGLTGGVNWWSIREVGEDPNMRHAVAITSEEQEEYYRKAALQGSRTLLMLRLMLEAGLQRQETARVRSEDLVEEPVGWKLRVRWNGRSRSFAVPSDLAYAIKKESEQHPDTPWLFPGLKGKHISEMQINRIIAGVDPHLHPRRLRISHLKCGLDKGLRVQDMAHTLGTTVQTVMKQEKPRKVRNSTAGKIGPFALLNGSRSGR